jgi:formate hydrogenlyase transcriptional activator
MPEVPCPPLGIDFIAFARGIQDLSGSHIDVRPFLHGILTQTERLVPYDAAWVVTENRFEGRLIHRKSHSSEGSGIGRLDLAFKSSDPIVDLMEQAISEHWIDLRSHTSTLATRLTEIGFASATVVGFSDYQEVRGLLVLAFESPANLHPGAMAALEFAAHETALTLGRAVVYVQRNALLEIGRALLTTESFEQLFRELDSHVMKILPHDISGIYALVEDSEMPFSHLVESSDFYTPAPMGPGELEHSIKWAMVRENRAVLIADVMESDFQEAEHLRQHGVRALMAVLLKMDETPIGVHYMGHRRPEVYRRGDLLLLEAIGRQISLAFDHLRTLEEVHRLKERVEMEARALRAEIEQRAHPTLRVESPAMQEVIDSIGRVAPTDSTVLLLGETGTGKEVLARELHALSHRHDKPLIMVNCAGLPESLIESELFGHEKGAFTGAVAKREGRFEVASGGTLFLDEIGDIPMSTQVRLLRVLQESEIERVGSSNTLKIDVRVVAATNADLQAKVARGEFREDLYYRLNVFPIRIPPLRERSEDLDALSQHFIEMFSTKFSKTITGISTASRAALHTYHWPGNVRELMYVMERAVILADTSTLRFDHLLPIKGHPHTRRSDDQPTIFQTLEEMEKDHIERALEMTGGKVGGKDGAAALLDLKRTTLQARMAKLGITPKKTK